MEKDIKTNNSQFSVSSQQIFLAETPRKKEATVVPKIGGISKLYKLSIEHGSE
jgi:hypothetical protein